MLKYMYTSISVPGIILKEVVKMDYVLLIVFLLAAMTVAGFIANYYISIRNDKIKKIVNIVFWIILAVCIIVLIAFLFDFFKILTQVQPI